MKFNLPFIPYDLQCIHYRRKNKNQHKEEIISAEINQMSHNQHENNGNLKFVEKKSFHWVSLIFQCEISFLKWLNEAEKKKERARETFSLSGRILSLHNVDFCVAPTKDEQKKKSWQWRKLKERRKLFFVVLLREVTF